MEVALIIVLMTVLMVVGVVWITVWGAVSIVRALGKAVRGLFAKPSPKLDGGAVPPRRKKIAPQQAQGTAQAPAPAQMPRAGYAQHAQRRRDYEYLDVDAGTTPDHIVEVMRAYEHERVIGFYALEVIDSIMDAQFSRKQLFSEIDSQFDKLSLSWAKFAEPADAAYDAILRNAALLANRVQAFDVGEYEDMERFYRTGGFSANAGQDKARLERWRLMDETKREMDRLRSASQGLLLELEKLLKELRKLSSSESDEESARIAEEVSRLVDETKYYR